MWKIKLAVKILGGRLPWIKTVLKALGFYRHGPMDSPQYAIGVFNKHFMRSGILVGTQNREEDLWVTGRPIQRDRPLAKVSGGVCLELGPGESLLTMLIAKAVGYEKTILVDKGTQIRQDIAPYLKMARHLKSLGYDIPEVNPGDTVMSLLPRFDAVYLTDGLLSLQKVPPNSVDFSFSHAVFEHIPRSEAGEFVKELNRVSTREGFSSHTVDLKDHMGGSTNHLRFPDSFWESEAVYRSGIYTNRLRFSEWMSLFSASIPAFQIIWKNRFPVPQLSPGNLAPQFRKLPERDLIINGFDILLRFDTGIEGPSIDPMKTAEVRETSG